MVHQHRYFIVNKPRDMVSQFISSDEVRLLGDLDFKFPPGTHAIGRLDSDSEGLLILTTNTKVTRLLFSSAIKHVRTYLVQVNNILRVENLELLRTGVSIKIAGGEEYIACGEVEIVNDPLDLYPHTNDVKGYGPHTWLTISLTEGKFRQVRKMIAAIRHRCKRLIRISIEDLELADLPPGEIKELDETDFFKKLRIPYPANDGLESFGD
jgi:23S rRNA pseudouridine2457 synthase